jgi:hypothetical protein
MTARELLETAIALARLDGPLACRWCGCETVTVEDRAGLGPIPVTGHYAHTLGDVCPALYGDSWAYVAGTAGDGSEIISCPAREVHEDLWARLDEWLPPADYGDDSELAVVDEELAAL